MIAYIKEDLAKLGSIAGLYKPITFFGSARLDEKSFFYKEAKKLATQCVEAVQQTLHILNHPQNKQTHKGKAS
mgnify:CR=1 FL=1